MRIERQSPGDQMTADDGQGLFNRQQEKIAQWLTKVRFRRKIVLGVDEKHVWKKIGELNDMYSAALLAERIRYDALLERQMHPCQPDAACRSAPQQPRRYRGGEGD